MTLRTTSYVILLAAMLRAVSMHAQAPSWMNAWSFPMHGTEQPMGAGLDAAGNIYLTSFLLDFTAGDPADMVKQFLISSSPDGTRRWTRTFLAGTGSLRGGMDVDAAGNAYVAAAFVGTWAIIDRGDRLDTLRSPHGGSSMVAKYNAEGQLLWHLIVAGSDSVKVQAVAIAEGGIWIGGSFTGTVDFGETRLTSAGRSDVFIALLDSSGIFRRAFRAGGGSTDEIRQIAVDRTGEVVMLGVFNGTASFGDRSVTATGRANFFLARFRADGTPLWVRADGGPAFEPAQLFMPTPMQLELDRDGNIYVAISYLDTISIDGNSFPSLSEADAILVKYRPNGAGEWGYLYSGDLLQLIEGVAIDTDGSIFISGFSQVLPDGTIFLTKLSADGEQMWQATSMWGGSMGGGEGGPICIDARHTIYMTGHFDGKVRFGDKRITSFESSDSSIAGTDVFVALIGSTSGVPLGGAGDDASFSVIVRDGEIVVVPGVNAPDVVVAAVYSIVGEKVAETARGGGEIRFDVGGVARGAYVVVLQTESGMRTYRVIVGTE